MKIISLSFGKLKTPGLRSSADYYSSLIKKWSQFTEIELKSEVVETKSPEIRKGVQQREHEMILDKLNQLRKTTRILPILLDETGPAYPSTEWARKLETWYTDAGLSLVFIMGSSQGFLDSFKKENIKVSLGPQTLSHELIRVVLYEQLYRALSITHGHPYHHLD